MLGRSAKTVSLLMLFGALVATAYSQTEPAPSATAVATVAHEDSVANGLRLEEQNDFAAALKLFAKAAEQGNAEGAFRAGLILLSGRAAENDSQANSVAEDLPRAVLFLKQAANGEHSEAMRVLGACFAKGRGVVRDRVEACKWWSLAANRGDAPAKEYYNSLVFELDGAERAEVHRRITGFVPRIARPAAPAVSVVPDRLRLNGISGAESRRIALINNQAFSAGEQKKVPLAGTNLLVRCVEIGATTVRIQTNGAPEMVTLGFTSR